MNGTWKRRRGRVIIAATALLLLGGTALVLTAGGKSQKSERAFSLRDRSYSKTCGIEPQNAIPADPKGANPLDYVYRTLSTLEERAGIPLGEPTCTDIFRVSTQAEARCTPPESNAVLRWCTEPKDVAVTRVAEESGSYPYFFLDPVAFERWAGSQPPPNNSAITLGGIMHAYASYLHHKLAHQAATPQQQACYMGVFVMALRGHADNAVLDKMSSNDPPAFKRGQRDPLSCRG